MQLKIKGGVACNYFVIPRHLSPGTNSQVKTACFCLWDETISTHRQIKFLPCGCFFGTPGLVKAEATFPPS